MLTIFVVIVVCWLIVAALDDTNGPGPSAGANHVYYHGGE